MFLSHFFVLLKHQIIVQLSYKKETNTYTHVERRQKIEPHASLAYDINFKNTCTLRLSRMQLILIMYP